MHACISELIYVGFVHVEEPEGLSFIALQRPKSCVEVLLVCGLLVREDLARMFPPPADRTCRPSGERSIAITGSVWGRIEHTALD